MTFPMLSMSDFYRFTTSGILKGAVGVTSYEYTYLPDSLRQSCIDTILFAHGREYCYTVLQNRNAQVVGV